MSAGLDLEVCEMLFQDKCKHLIKKYFVAALGVEMDSK